MIEEILGVLRFGMELLEFSLDGLEFLIPVQILFDMADGFIRFFQEFAKLRKERGHTFDQCALRDVGGFDIRLVYCIGVIRVCELVCFRFIEHWREVWSLDNTMSFQKRRNFLGSFGEPRAACGDGRKTIFEIGVDELDKGLALTAPKPANDREIENLLLAEFPVSSVDLGENVAGIDEEYFIIGLRLVEKPERGRKSHRVEHIGWKREHPVDQIVLYQGFADFGPRCCARPMLSWP